MNSKTGTASSRTQKSSKKKRAHKPSKVILSTFRMFIFFAVTFSIIVGGILSGMALAYVKTAEDLTADQLMLKGFTTRVYDCNGNEIMALQGDKNREMVDFKDIPQDLKDAFVSIEDKRFYEHPGIDIKRITGAVINFFKPGASSYGGSTITQQVIKNLTGNEERSVKRKVQEWRLALGLERKLSKDQILEIYMNLIYMGQNCYGVQAASQTYFNKDVSELTLAECASLAGITNWPGRYDPFTEKGKENNIARQRVILKEMLDQGYITQTEYNSALNEELKFADSNKRTSEYVSNQPYFIDQVVKDVKRDLMTMGYSEELAIRTIYNNGLQIYTTMDSNIQKAMDEVFKDEKYFTKVNKKTSQTPQAAMVIIDPNGYVRALYGGSGEKIGAPLNRASDSQVQRQPGSTFKPIAIYGPAINERRVTAATIVDDAPVYMMGADKSAYPTNFDYAYGGLTTVRNGIKRSVNVVAAKVWQEILGPDLSLEYLDRVNINRDNERYLSLAMGGLYKGVNPLQMAAAYVPFVSKGLYYEPITYTKVLDMKGNVLLEKKPQSTIVYDEAAAYIMVDMMRSVVRESGGTAVGLGQLQNGKMPSAGKTGTTSDNYDKWFVGFSPYYVGAVWYGYDHNASISSAESSRALQIWHDVMEKVHENLEPIQFTEPQGIVKKDICIYSGKVATDLCSHDPRGSAVRNELFIKGTEPSDDDVCDVHVRAQVCKASTDANGNSLLAGDYCPHESVEEKIFIRRPVPYVPTKAGEKAPSDLKYELPEGEYCNIHGPSMEQTPSDIPNTPDEKPYDRTLWIDFLDELDQTLPRVFRRDD